MKLWREKSRDLVPIEPKVVTTGPILENELKGSSIDVLRFPAPKWHEHDGGRYIGTGDLVITKDPDQGWVNMGVYRCMVHDSRTLGIHIWPTHHGGLMMNGYWSRGEDAPVVIVLGQDPHLYAAACTPLQWGKSELEYAGALGGGPVKVIVDRGTGLPVPASAEIAIVGRVPPIAKESRAEGPFGECTGYYAGNGRECVVHVERILHRDEPILQGNPPMCGSARLHSLGAELTTSAAVWDSLEREVPNVKGVFSLYQPCQAGSSILVVSIKQSFAGHSLQAGMVALSAHAAILMNRAVIVVDDDVDPSDSDDVLFAVTSRCDPSRDVKIITGTPSYQLDLAHGPAKSESGDATSSSMIIDATRKPYSMLDAYPRVNAISPELEAAVRKKWSRFLSSDRRSPPAPNP